MIKQEGLYQNKVNSSLGSIHNCKMAYCRLGRALCKLDVRHGLFSKIKIFIYKA